MDTGNTSQTRIAAPIVVYIVHHPDCDEAKKLATQLFRWFRLGDFAGDSAAAGLPVYYRRELKEDSIQPEICWDEAEVNVVIVLVDHRMVLEDTWRVAILELAKNVAEQRQNDKQNQSLLLPVALHESFYRMGLIYNEFNPVRLLDMSTEQMEAVLRRAATEAIARRLPFIEEGDQPAPLNVFLSHAKRDGTPIAEQLRDGVRSFSQLVAWYDANDLPYGSAWESPMKHAVNQGTAAMIATITDAYPTRPWCRQEATLARTPRPMKDPSGSSCEISHVWTLQPVVAVHEPGSAWAQGVPMLVGVPRIGWDENNPEMTTAAVVDRLVLEVLLARTHCRVALKLKEAYGQPDMVFITWVPDIWTLVDLRKKLSDNHISVKHIAYPGYGLPTIELAELQPVLSTFGADVDLISYEEVGHEPYTKASTPKRVALSAGGDDRELARYGLGQEHINQLMVRLSRKLLQDDHQLVYGGILGAPDNELADLIIDAIDEAVGHLSEPTTKPIDLADPASWPLVNYAIWPYYHFISQEHRARLIGVCCFIDVPPNDAVQDELTPLLHGDKADLWARRYTADALTRMREMSTNDTDFRIVWGGKIRGAMGWMAGIAEEVLFSLAHKKPMLILGGFGGCAALLADFIKDPDAPWPEELTIADACRDKQYDALVKNNAHLIDLIKQYDDLKQHVTDLRKELHEKKDKNEAILGIPSQLFLDALNETGASQAIRLARKAADKVLSTG